MRFIDRFPVLVGGRSIKPSAAIFRRALEPFPTGTRILFVGDDLARDIRPAHALGLTTAWVAPRSSSAPEADRIVESILELEQVLA